MPNPYPSTMLEDIKRYCEKEQINSNNIVEECKSRLKNINSQYEAGEYASVEKRKSDHSGRLVVIYQIMEIIRKWEEE